MSLRWKLALSLALVGAFVAASFGVTAYVLTRNRLYEEVDRSLRQNVSEIEGREAREGREQGGRPDPRGERINFFDIYAVQQINTSGTVVAGSGLSILPVGAGDVAIAQRGYGSRVRTADVADSHVRILTEGISGGAIMVGRDLAESERVLSTIQVWTLVLVAIAALGSAFLGWLIAWSMTRPLRRLTDAAEHVAETERLDADVPASGADEVGRLAGAFRDMLASLRQSRDAQRTLVQDASHELKTPLTSIRTNTAVLRKYPDLAPDERSRILTDLNDEVEELVALVDELVDAALEGRSDEPVSEVDLGDVARRVAARVERRTGHTIVVESDASVVDGQVGLLERAVTNLMDNAAKFDTSSEPIRCTVAAGRLEVRDHGPGIPAADQAHVFERFYRSDAARSAPGSGLGLAIVRDIAVAHGGEVFVGDGSAGGAVIGFTLPLASASEIA